MEPVENSYVWLCPHDRCDFSAFGSEGTPFVEECAKHGNKLLLKRTLVSAALNEAASSMRTRSTKTGDMMAFLATDRAMGTLSALQRIMDAPHARELWINEAFRTLIAGEWDVLKKLMQEAGFE